MKVKNIFKKDTTEDKRQKLIQDMAKVIAQNGLQEVSEPYKEQVKNISQTLARVSDIEDVVLKGAGLQQDRELLNIYYEKALLEQNFLIIKLLDDTLKQLKRRNY